MKAMIVALLLAPAIAFAHGGDVYVHGYEKSNGTYVQPHMRSAPDGNVYNNWSTTGNVNPYTGQAGHHNPNGGSAFGSSATPSFY